MLLAAWFVVGVVPFVLRTQSFMKFATPNKITENRVISPAVQPETSNMT
ncbi:hypothetical protein PC118_g5027 [Phytophthora cactorum]|uniref:Uncharacterized protein n=1 Tax=Phytophthora cactorum TaxID=29920 RepID=A0A8T1CPX4_9STRA|nr:hypothetical protein PC112_g7939 [Phytophthora cactorum]KAG2928979.1 hypothetical protein PC115_g7045 [Phytophthora cactorum]KAG2945527.1 hypothetical protein PC117_g8360 [Phytophthora cactorum]KAG2991559.1 hypothetical protein PC118_g5027 [Phytophthora cactorum]KAG3024466.1 hypothetical protein PC120_g7049 [Phytophthora cactorum]